MGFKTITIFYQENTPMLKITYISKMHLIQGNTYSFPTSIRTMDGRFTFWGDKVGRHLVKQWKKDRLSRELELGAMVPETYYYWGGGARLMVSAVCRKTCIFFIQDKILLGGMPPIRIIGGQLPPPLPPPPPLPAPPTMVVLHMFWDISNDK